MRTSEALMMGSLQLSPKPYCVDDGNGFGCAIGMIDVANGRVSTHWSGGDVEWMILGVPLPCSCKTTCELWTAASAMIHLFNEHVCKDIFTPNRLQPYGGEDYTMADKWTLEQLADWLESVDPTPKETPEEKHEVVEMYCESLVKR
jgi:hypothetical protein